MTATAPLRATGSAAWADTLLLSFAKAGYALAEPPILQPAEPFLDLSGEDIRKSLYLTTDATGEELCLRPDLTIPVARQYLASGEAGQAAGFSYLGPVFRYRDGARSEFLQAGIESLRIGGTLILAGTVLPTPSIALDPEAVVRRLLTIRGVHNYAPRDLGVPGLESLRPGTGSAGE